MHTKLSFSSFGVLGAAAASQPVAVKPELVGSIWSGEAVLVSGAEFRVSLNDRYHQTVKDTHHAGSLLDGISVLIKCVTPDVQMQGDNTMLVAQSGYADFGLLVITGPVASTVSLEATILLAPPLSARQELRLNPCRIGDIPPPSGKGKSVSEAL